MRVLMFPYNNCRVSYRCAFSLLCCAYRFDSLFFVLLFLRQQRSTYENVRFEEYLNSFHKKTVSRLHFHWFLRLFRGAPRYIQIASFWLLKIILFLYRAMCMRVCNTPSHESCLNVYNDDVHKLN